MNSAALEVVQVNFPHVPDLKAEAGHLEVLLNQVAQQRDRDAFIQLFRYFAPRVKSFLMNRGLPDAAADDVLQEVMLAVWEKAGSYNSQKSKVSTWVFTIARYKYIDRMRRNGRRPTESADFEDHESSDVMSEDEVLHEQQKAALHEAIQKLPVEQQGVIILSFQKGLTHSEISKQLGLPLGTVKSRLRRAFSKLREDLDGIPLSI